MKETNADTLEYSEFWNRNLQQIEDIKQSLLLSINRLEKKHSEFESIFAEIMEKINTLSSIYSSFNSIQGLEYVLKLKAIMHESRKKYITEGIDFNLISYIIDKVSSMTAESFENFPALYHNSDSNDDIIRITIDPKKEIKHKWLTFEKNGYWFILKYNEIKVINKENLTSEKNLGGGSLEISDGKEKYICRNIFSGINSLNEHNNCYIISDSGRKNFSASSTGKRIYAAKDFISSMIKGYSKNMISEISPGRVKLFGKNHIVLN